ncbi:hypothetical protein GCM10011348_37460 [Marinobacterium nitratireducens]|uniref:Uncharacterized protein n=1 Tax=Marinobacterium nitratireducens TaxID=518897 RepID=A0A918DX67_9GAMM|nr:hypothetical protein GCM10011348_37460 [Marinobacterium nitratireducens]
MGVLTTAAYVCDSTKQQSPRSVAGAGALYWRLSGVAGCYLTFFFIGEDDFVFGLVTAQQLRAFNQQV